MRKKNAGKGKSIGCAVIDKVKVMEVINDHDLVVEGKAESPDRKIQEKAGKARWKAGKVIKKPGRIISGRR